MSQSLPCSMKSLFLKDKCGNIFRRNHLCGICFKTGKVYRGRSVKVQRNTIVQSGDKAPLHYLTFVYVYNFPSRKNYI